MPEALPLPILDYNVYIGDDMPPKLVWLVAVVRLAITPVFLGALLLWVDPQRSSRDIAVGCGLALLGALHLLYWLRPWLARQRRAMAVAAVMVLTNLVLLHVLGLSQPLLWLYPALVIGAGLRPPVAAVGVGLMALAAVLPVEMEGMRQVHALGPGQAIALPPAVTGEIRNGGQELALVLASVIEPAETAATPTP